VEAKKITFFIVGDETSETKKLVVPSRWLRTSLVSGVLFGIVVLAFVIDYMGVLIELQEMKKLKLENLQLKKQFQVVETKVTALESALERVKTFSSKLKLITNVEDENRGLKLSVGVEPKPGQNLDEPTAQAKQEANHSAPTPTVAEEGEISEETPLNESQGELAIEKSDEYSSLAIRIDRAVKQSQLREQSVIELWDRLANSQSLLNSTPSIRPARGWLVSKFGYRISPFTGKAAMHNGIDIAAAPGTPIFAPADGIVTFAAFDETYGKLIAIDHGYGIMTRFGHNSQIYVQVGQKVKRWDVIAAIGNTGRSTGPHCHYEVRLNNVPIDPSNYILDE
jgi:murein DD-endopeptidase MepM/ murein hydrolase activator NlpD